MSLNLDLCLPTGQASFDPLAERRRGRLLLFLSIGHREGLASVTILDRDGIAARGLPSSVTRLLSMGKRGPNEPLQLLTLRLGQRIGIKDRRRAAQSEWRSPTALAGQADLHARSFRCAPARPLRRPPSPEVAG